ncbi:MAG: hypothetical protein PHU94_02155 [Bacilli bacterium]|nr:hypothetical protein [Bacilli bacterium]MDD4733658.1 hypothetical protein [Bacilli bacterium]
MKKNYFFSILLTIIILTSGCVRQNYNFSIDKDKNMDISVIVALDSAFFDEEGISDEDVQKVKDLGFKVTEYTDENYKGVIATKRIKNIDNYSKEEDVQFLLNTLFEEKIENIKLFSIKKGILSNKYKAYINFDTTDLTERDENTDYNDELETEEDIEYSEQIETDEDQFDTDPQKILSYMDLKYSITLPYGSISNNATDVSEDGKTLTWDFAKITDEKGELTPIEYEFEIYNLTLIYIATGTVGLIVLLIIVLIISKKGKSKKNKNLDTTKPIEEVVEKEENIVTATPIVNNDDTIENDINNLPTIENLGQVNFNQTVNNVEPISIPETQVQTSETLDLNVETKPFFEEPVQPVETLNLNVEPKPFFEEPVQPVENLNLNVEPKPFFEEPVQPVETLNLNVEPKPFFEEPVQPVETLNLNVEPKPFFEESVQPVETLDLNVEPKPFFEESVQPVETLDLNVEPKPFFEESVQPVETLNLNVEPSVKDIDSEIK